MHSQPLSPILGRIISSDYLNKIDAEQPFIFFGWSLLQAGLGGFCSPTGCYGSYSQDLKPFHVQKIPNSGLTSSLVKSLPIGSIKVNPAWKFNFYWLKSHTSELLAQQCLLSVLYCSITAMNSYPATDIRFVPLQFEVYFKFLLL